MCGCLSHTPQLGTWPATQACALTVNRTGNSLVRRPALNPLRHTSQGKIPFFKDFIYLFLEKGEGREEERERNTDQLPLAHPQPGT